MTILTRHNVQVVSTSDVVNLRLGHNRLILYYQNTFEICNAVKMAAKLAQRHEGLQIPSWRETLKTMNVEIPKRVKMHKGFRRGGVVSNVSKWAVKWEGSLVVLIFDDLTCKLHYSDAFRLYLLLRANARNAKAWAGDPSKSMRGLGHLVDAEENYKHGWAT